MKEYLASKRKFISPNQFEALLETDFSNLTLVKKLFYNLDNGEFIARTFIADIGSFKGFGIFENYSDCNFQEEKAYKVHNSFNMKKNDISDAIFENEEVTKYPSGEPSKEVIAVQAIKNINGKDCLFNFKKCGEGIVSMSIAYKYYGESEKEIARETVALASAYANRLYSITFDTPINEKDFDEIVFNFKKASLIVRNTVEHGEFTYQKDHFAPISNYYNILDLLKDDFYLDGATFVYMENKQLLQTKQLGKGSLSIEITNINGDKIPRHLYKELDEAKETKYILFTNSKIEHYLYENVKIYFAEDGKLHAKFFVTFHDLKSVEVAKKWFTQFTSDFEMLPKIEFDELHFKTLDIKNRHIDTRYMSDISNWALNYEVF